MADVCYTKYNVTGRLPPVFGMVLYLPQNEQAIAWLVPHTTHPSRRNHNFDTSWRRHQPCSADKPSRLPAPSTAARILLGSAASETQSPHNDLSAATATTAASPPSSRPPSLVPWHQARFSVTLPPPRGPDDRCRCAIVHNDRLRLYSSRSYIHETTAWR